MKEIYITITLPDYINEKILYFKRKISDNFNLKIRQTPLHITLRSTFFIKDKDYSKLLDDLNVYFSNYKPFKIKINDFTVFHNRIVVLNINKSKTIDKLARNIVLICEKYRVKNKNYNKISKYSTPRQIEYFKGFGDQYIFEFYKPHLTLLYNTNHNIKMINEYIRKKKKIIANDEFIGDHISIIEKIETDFGKKHYVANKIYFKKTKLN